MKVIRCLCVILIIAILLPTQIFATCAANNNNELIYLDDGSYITITLLISETRSNDKTASKIYTHYNASDTALWSATLTATFTFDGTEYWATESSISTEIYSDNWYEVSKSASISGCGATGEVTMGRKLLGVTVDKESVTITLFCSPYGTIT